ncbi:endolytic transglycosylase MltG [Halobacillus litoralis]|uniref:Aminodeoxychorismate lyase n=1 Tax=Halobacillus litoralis TaxID=45668 RepID=A0A410MHP9_9BACI|nr:endolytic transglycosylase MltG [Halobacillus litoralis]QAS54185.1 hypothetical protein HLI_19200 [Halobacillus litoralis]
MKHLIRSYSIGLLTAAIVVGITYWNSEEPSVEVKEKSLGTEKMISQLEEDGYHVVSNEEWEAQQQTTARSSDKEKEKSTHVTFSIDIVSGTNSTEISQKLQQANIIDDANAFETFMKENDYSRFIQIGQATLNSGMTHQEIAEAITSK